MKKQRLALLALLASTLLAGCAIETAPPPQGRSGDQLNFSGRTWTVKGGTELFGPGPNYFSKDLRSAYLDDRGYLHLNIRKFNDNRWYCSEVISNDVVGYGRYVWVVESDMVNIPDNTVLGLFTWDNNTLVNEANSEVDIEFSRWGVAGDPKTLHMSVQPVWFGPFKAERTRGYQMPAAAATTHTTHEFIWTDSLISWKSWLGDKSNDPPFATWEFDLNNPARVKEEGGITSRPIIIPAPGPTTNARINLWLVTNQATGPSTANDYEIVIRSFLYEPF
jgi:hypothetical protein